MSTKKFKLTGFARFFIAMLFIAPMAYLGASYYNGQDGIENIKVLLGLSEKVEANHIEVEDVAEEAVKEMPTQTKATPSKESANNQVEKLKEDLSEKEDLIEKLSLENEALEKQLKKKDAELTKVKKQLNNIKKAIGQ